MEITTFDKLSKEDQALVKTAMEARENAYTPYSNHKVGSAVRTANVAPPRLMRKPACFSLTFAPPTERFFPAAMLK